MRSYVDTGLESGAAMLAKPIDILNVFKDTKFNSVVLEWLCTLSQSIASEPEWWGPSLLSHKYLDGVLCGTEEYRILTGNSCRLLRTCLNPPCQTKGRGTQQFSLSHKWYFVCTPAQGVMRLCRRQTPTSSFTFSFVLGIFSKRVQNIPATRIRADSLRSRAS